MNQRPSRMTGKFQFSAAIFCDAVRIENTGKLILIGVYAGDVLCQRYPAELEIVAHVEGRVLEADVFRATFQFVDQDDAALSTPIEIDNDRPFVVGGFALPITARLVFHKSGRCILRAKLEGGKWQVLASKEVLLQEEYARRLAELNRLETAK